MQTAVKTERRRESATKQASSSPGPAQVSLSTACGRYQWLQRTLSMRGATCMPLPLGVPLDTNCQALLELTKACAPFATARQGGSEPHIALAASAEAAVWQHARLNYLLPALAPVACVACAMHMHAAPGAYVGGAAIADSALWLRRFLAPDLDDALGTETFTCKMHVLCELAQLVTDGVLVQRTHNADSVSPTENAEDGILAVRGSAAAAPQDEFAVAPAGRALMAASSAALAPVVCTYAAVLQHALASAERLPQGSGAFVDDVLAALRTQCEGRGSALGAVPSKLLVQHGVASWAVQGFLTCDAGAPLQRNVLSRAVPTAVFGGCPLLPIPRPGKRGGVLAGASRVLAHAQSTGSFSGSAAEGSPTGGRSSAGEQPRRGQRGSQASAQGGIASAADQMIHVAAAGAESGRDALNRLRRSLQALQPVEIGWLE